MNGTCISEYDYRLYWRKLHAANQGAVSTVGYAPFGEGFNRACYVLRRQAVARLMGRHPGVLRARLLEAAVGVGAYAPVWRRIGVTGWTGLDIAEEAVAHCRRSFPEGRFLVQDLACDTWPESSAGGEFDLVTAIDVLYHLTDDLAFATALRNLSSRVRKGGALIVSDVFVPRDRQIAAHVKRRSVAAYSRVLGAGMTLVDREPVFSILADPVPAPSRRLRGILMSTAWRAVARAVLSTPKAARDTVGAAAVLLAWPLDAMLRRLEFARQANLELALFRRD
jgi:2-polyprenyl-3-methyl-5-hydroxy-6-metoxy-1,4-benzoquinol methylase